MNAGVCCTPHLKASIGLLEQQLAPISWQEDK